MYKETWLINVEEFWDRKKDFKDDRWDVSFYCKDCAEIVDTQRLSADSYIFECKKCWWRNIAIWTLEWLKSNYKI